MAGAAGMSGASFAKRVFIGGGIYGVLGVAPMYFLESRVGTDMPPAINHPEFFYGFIGVTLAWQLAFLVIGTDPMRYRPLMLPAMVEKLSFVAAIVILFAQGRVHVPLLLGAAGDFVLLVLFVMAWLRTRPQ
ncbi:MAG TPA: hypothetical protein VEL28_23260 [Candidatus Binatia bacterium]|nr:hypothetical protein [Candidatus Binatia bacterium]